MAIVVAMRMEEKALLKLIGRHHAGRLGRLRTWSFEAGPCQCVLVRSGMGMEPARKATRALAESVRPGLLVSFGIAGAVGEGIAVGDIVAGERCCAWENRRLGPAFPLARLSETAQQAATRAAEACGARFFRGTILTVRGIHPAPPAPGETAVVEMETAAIAEEAAARGIPLVSLRAVSDTPREPIPFEMNGGEEFHVQPLVLLGAILRDPRNIRRLLRLKRNSGRAARNLAQTVNAVLGLFASATPPRGRAARQRGLPPSPSRRRTSPRPSSWPPAHHPRSSSPPCGTAGD